MVMGTRELERVEAEFYRSLNLVVEPLVRAGLLGAPGPWWMGPIVVETRGRKTGRIFNVPLPATQVGDLLVVSTLRGQRAQWVKNLAAHPDVRYWLGGRPYEARAFVFPPGQALPTRESMPPLVQSLASSLVPLATQFGFTGAILSPR